MIDTIKISVERFKIENPCLFVLNNSNRTLNDVIEKLQTRADTNRVPIYYSHLKPINDGMYRPRIEYTMTPYVNTLLYIEFSVPKLLFGNNLHEVREKDFEDVITVLHDILKELQIEVSKYELMNAVVRKVHYSKNFILDKELECIDIFNLFKLTKYNYAGSLKDYIENKAIQTRNNTFAISMYNKISEIIDSDDIIDTKIVDNYKNRILRLEFKFENPDDNSKLAHNILGLSRDTKLKFGDVFKEDVFKKVFYDSLNKLNKNMPKIVYSEKVIEDLEKISCNFDELAKRNLFISYQQKYGDYNEAIRKLQEGFAIRDNTIKKYNTLLTDKEKLKTIVSDFVEEIKNYTPIQEKLNNK